MFANSSEYSDWLTYFNRKIKDLQLQISNITNVPENQQDDLTQLSFECSAFFLDTDQFSKDMISLENKCESVKEQVYLYSESIKQQISNIKQDISDIETRMQIHSHQTKNNQEIIKNITYRVNSLFSRVQEIQDSQRPRRRFLTSPILKGNNSYDLYQNVLINQTNQNSQNDSQIDFKYKFDRNVLPLFNNASVNISETVRKSETEITRVIQRYNETIQNLKLEQSFQLKYHFSLQDHLLELKRSINDYSQDITDMSNQLGKELILFQ